MVTWRNTFLEHVNVSGDPKAFPFIVIGNKTDLLEQRVVDQNRAKAWCAEIGNVPYFETSALNNVMVEEAFLETAKVTLKKNNQNQFSMPDSLSGASGAIKLNPNDDLQKQEEKKKKKKCKC